MITTYRCELCGFSSSDRGTIQECEKQGGVPRFQAGETVMVPLQITGYKPTPAKVVQIRCEERSHAFTYIVEPTLPGVAKAWWQIRDSRKREKVTTIPEGSIK